MEMFRPWPPSWRDLLRIKQERARYREIERQTAKPGLARVLTLGAGLGAQKRALVSMFLASCARCRV